MSTTATNFGSPNVVVVHWLDCLLKNDSKMVINHTLSNILLVWRRPSVIQRECTLSTYFQAENQTDTSNRDNVNLS